MSPLPHEGSSRAVGERTARRAPRSPSSARRLTERRSSSPARVRSKVESVNASDRELQQYLFDLQGYLVIHNVLSAAEVAELNRLIDAQRLPRSEEHTPELQSR